VPDGVANVIEEKTRVVITGFSLKDAFATRQFWLIFVMFMFFSMSANTIMVHLVPHLIDLGISATIAATVLVGLNVAGVLVELESEPGDKLGTKGSLRLRT